MSNNEYGDLGNEMRAMKDGRASLMAGIKDDRKRIRAEAGQTLAAADRFVAETGKANERLAAQTRQMLSPVRRELKARTRQMLSPVRRELKARTRQTLAEANKLAAAIRKDVAALKADAGRIITDANGFLAQTGSDNNKLRGQTHKMLAGARAESKAQARKVMTQTKAAVAGLKMETGRVLADATGVMKRLSDASRQRAARWRDVLRTVRGDGRGAPARASVAAVVMERPARTKPKGKKKASAEKN